MHREQLEFVDIYAEQIQRWRTQGLSAAQTPELDRLEEQNRHLRAVTTDVLALAQELRTGTIDRIMAMSDLEVGLQAILALAVFASDYADQNERDYQALMDAIKTGRVLAAPAE